MVGGQVLELPGGGEDWSGEGLIEAAARELEWPSSYRSREGLEFSVMQILANGKGGGVIGATSIQARRCH